MKDPISIPVAGSGTAVRDRSERSLCGKVIRTLGRTDDAADTEDARQYLQRHQYAEPEPQYSQPQYAQPQQPPQPQQSPQPQYGGIARGDPYVRDVHARQPAYERQGAGQPRTPGGD